jgi:hypothetical protein
VEPRECLSNAATVQRSPLQSSPKKAVALAEARVLAAGTYGDIHINMIDDPLLLARTRHEPWPPPGRRKVGKFVEPRECLSNAATVQRSPLQSSPKKAVALAEARVLAAGIRGDIHVNRITDPLLLARPRHKPWPPPGRRMGGNSVEPCEYKGRHTTVRRFPRTTAPPPRLPGHYSPSD